jgi:ferritin-like metal-binding protein YciE
MLIHLRTFRNTGKIVFPNREINTLILTADVHGITAQPLNVFFSCASRPSIRVDLVHLWRRQKYSFGGMVKVCDAPQTDTNQNLRRCTVQQSELKELYVDELKDIYSAEAQLVKALPKMANAAVSTELRNGFEQHLEQTKGHVDRLEKIFHGLDQKPTGKHCNGMEGLIKEGGEAAEEDYQGDAKDAALIGAAQRVEHYEIAAYGTVRAMAEKLGESEAVKLLSQTLQEEKDTDVKLSKVAAKMTIEEDNETREEAPSRLRSPKGKAAKA